MANTRTDTEYSAYAKVDTAPAADGYFTSQVAMRDNKVRRMYFSMRETDEDASPVSDVTVTLQYRCAGDAGWTDYVNDDVTIGLGCRLLIDGGAAGEIWRAGVKSGGYTSGDVTFGFDW